jgi:hypothetical protein
VAAENAEPRGTGEPAGPFGSRLAAARAAVAELAAAAGQLRDAADDDVSEIMAELTTMVGQLDGLRVAVTALVRERGLHRLRGASNVAGWLRADARTADEAWQLSRLASMVARLPKISGLLSDGSVSLSQAGTACWQISQLPPVVERPEDADAQAALTDPPEPDDPWVGLWRNGDVHAAADELFARFLPGMDGAQLRVLGAHLREAADAQERAGEDYSDFSRRALRISRTLGGVAHLTGRLHPEAAEQVIAAFEDLGAKAGPDDQRTKAQRWADALAYLAGLAPSGAASPATDPHDPADPGHDEPSPDGERCRDDWVAEPDDEPSADGGHGHEHTSGHGQQGPAGHGQDSAGYRHPHIAPGTGATAAAMGGTSAATAGTAAGTSGNAAGTSGTVPAGLRRPRVIVTVPLSTLLGQPLAPGAVLGAGTPIAAEAARRLCCDAEIVRLVTSQQPGLPGGVYDGTGRDATARLTALLAEAIGQLPRPLGGPSATLDIGRKSQSWTPRQRDALYAQYGGRCGRPGCSRPIDVIHHIVHWLFGGKTQVINGAPFCLYDHWLVHEGGWRVSKQPDGALTFIPPPPGWRPGTVYRRGKPLPETSPHQDAA